MKVLVVGASGFLGGAVADRLSGEGHEVVAMSRSGRAVAGTPVCGDVRKPRLGLDRRGADELRAGLTHVVSCFGSVAWGAGPRTSAELHALGTRNVLDFVRGVPSLERIVHVSTVLVFGKARQRVGNRELQVGQTFRNWYEYGKFLAERTVRAERDVPWRVLRVGPVLGTGPGAPPSFDDGLLAVVPFLLRGYPAGLAGGGEFPCYVSDVGTVAAVTAAAAETAGSGETWTWFDPARPSLAETLAEVCDAWGVVPRITDLPRISGLGSPLARRFGLPPQLVSYVHPWVDIDPAVLDDLPAQPPHPEGYMRATGHWLRDHGRPPVGAF